MKKYMNLTVAAALTLSLLTGCAAQGTSPAFAETVETTQTPNAAALTEGTEVLFTDDGITAGDTSGLEIDGTALTVTKSGTYLLSGQCANGSVKVKKGTVGVTLVLNGLNLTADGTAPIVCAKSTEVTILAAQTTENTLSDTENNSDESGNTEAENAVIKCKDGSQVTICGGGVLNIHAEAKNGIKSGASTQEEGEAKLTIRELSLNIDASEDGVNAEAALDVESGMLTIAAGDDALHCDYTLNIGAENTEGPSITVSSSYESLEGAVVNIYSGIVNLESTDDCINAANPDLTGYDHQLNILGGTVTAYTSTGDGFDSNGDLTISGGTVAVWSANSADNSPLDADGTVTISGGTVLAAGGSSGMGMNLNAQQPCLIFGTNQTAQMPGGDMAPQMPSGDNAQLPQVPEGGQMPNGQGGDRMEPPDQKSGNQRQGGMGGPQQAAGLLSANSSFAIQDSQGAALFSGTARCGASFLLISTPELTEGSTYTLSADGTETTAQAQSGTVSTGRGGQPGGRPQGGGQWPEGEKSGKQKKNNTKDEST